MRAGNSKPAIRVLWGDEKTHRFTKNSEEDLFSRFCAAACSKTTHQRGGYS